MTLPDALLPWLLALGVALLVDQLIAEIRRLHRLRRHH
jgi:hypothetical protein